MRAHLLRLAVALSVAAAGLGCVDPAVAAEAGEVVLPAQYGGRLAGSVTVIGGPAGIVAQGTDSYPGPTRLFRRDTEETTQLAAIEEFVEDGTVVGNQFVWGAYEGERMGAVDLATGTATPLTPPAGYRYLGGTGEGYATYAQANGQVTVTQSPVGLVGLPRTWTKKGTYVGGATDASSILVSVLDGKRRPFLLNHTDGSERTIAAETGSESKALALDAQRAYWVTPKGQIQSIDRTDTAATPTAVTPPGTGTITHLAASAGKVAFVRTTTANYESTSTIGSGPVGGPYKLVTQQLAGTARVFDAGGGNFTVHLRKNDFTEDLFDLASGATTLATSRFDPEIPIPAAIQATTGRLLTEVRGPSETALYSRPVGGSSDGELTVGKPTLVQANDQTHQSSGSRSIAYGYTTKGNVAIVLEGAKEIARVPIRESDLLQLSGNRILATRFCPLGCNPGVVPFGEVYDLNGGKPVAVPATSTIFGDHVAYVLDGGEIRYRKIGAKTERTLRQSGAPLGNVGVTAKDAGLRIVGDWVVWAFRRESVDSAGLDEPPAEVGAVSLTTGQRVDLTSLVRIPFPYYYTLQVADGRVAWIDRGSRDVHVIELATGTVRDLGRARFDLGRNVALTDEFVAWVAEDDTTHLLPLETLGRPSYLGAVAPLVFAPAKGAWRPRLEASRPLTSWKVEILSDGNVVRELRGTTSTGSIRPSWDGLDAAGKRVPDGPYSWTLTGTGPSGDLAPAGGLVRVDTTTPTPKLTLPTSATVAKGFTAKWSSTETGVKWTVKVALGTPSGKTVKYGTAKTWLTGTTLTSTTYKGSKVPFALKANRYYRFTVTATDAAGNTRSAPAKTVKVPK